MRTADLARAVGVSTQTVRNLEDRAVLPPTQRSDSGYRRYRQLHLDALRAYVDLSRAFGPAAAGEIVACATRGDGDSAVDTVVGIIAGLHRDGEHVDELREPVDRAPRSPIAATRVGRRSITEVARHLGIRASTLRVWEREFLIAPGRDSSGYRVFGPDDVQQAATVQALRGAGMGLPQIRAVLAGTTAGTRVDDLAVALDRRAREIRHRKRLALTAAGSLDDYLESQQAALIDASAQAH